MAWIGHILFIHSAVDGHMSCLYILATVNNAAMNICVPIFSIWMYLCLMSFRMEFLGQMVAGHHVLIIKHFFGIVFTPTAPVPQ